MCAPKNHAMENHVRRGLAVWFFFSIQIFFTNPLQANVNH